jgi:hypothetical protein
VTQNSRLRFFFYRKETRKTTWKFRLLVAALLAVTIVLPRAFWVEKIGQSLICPTEPPRPSDALLLENFDVDYLIFERAAVLQRSGVGSRAFVPTLAGKDPAVPNRVSIEFVEVMARLARLDKFEAIPIQQIEPISLNAAKQIRDFLKGEQITSLVVVTPGFRSRRSELVYKAVLEPAGITVSCVAVFGPTTATDWDSTWHGIQETLLQFLKLQYYRFWVLL